MEAREHGENFHLTETENTLAIVLPKALAFEIYLRLTHRRLGTVGVAGMVLGIVGLVFSFIPVFGSFVAFPCVAVGLPLSSVGFYQARKSGTGMGMPIAGITTNLIAIVILILWITVLTAVFATTES